jgi:DNA-binding NarL/FixJ family response regulator
VLDLTMPELSGLEVTRQIRQALPRTEVVVLTMYEPERFAQEVFDAGALSFIVKTEARRQLVAAVEAVARHKPFFTPTIAQLIMQGHLHPRTSDAKAKRGALQLTPREREIVQLVAEGKTTKEIADGLGRSIKTIEAHRTSVMHKLGFRSVVDMVHYAIRNKIVGP